jgi:hypothetical protein
LTRTIVGIAAALLAGGLAGRAQARPFCSDPPFIPALGLTRTNGSSVFETQKDIAPGDLACFKLTVNAASKLHVTVAGSRGDAYVMVYPPGWTITRDGRSFTFGEDPLPGAAPADQARAWTGPFPQSGPALIVVAMRQGGGQYRLHVEAE